MSERPFSFWDGAFGRRRQPRYEPEYQEAHGQDAFRVPALGEGS